MLEVLILLKLKVLKYESSYYDRHWFGIEIMTLIMKIYSSYNCYNSNKKIKIIINILKNLV